MLNALFSSLRARRIFYRIVLFIGDTVLVGISLRLAYATRFESDWFLALFPVTKGFPSLDIYLPLQWSALVIWLMTFALSGFYQRINLLALDEFIRMMRGVATGWVFVLA